MTDPHSEAFAKIVVAGLSAQPRTLSPALFYDAQGSRLFEEITRQPEYYQTRTERSILESARTSLAEHLPGTIELVELGAGSAEKTETLLDALDVSTYWPVDVSPTALEGASQRLAIRFPTLTVNPVVQNYHDPIALPAASNGTSRVAFFPGSTIGNIHPEVAIPFLARVADMVGPEGAFVLGVDLVKDPKVLHAAYNDEAGVTAQFNVNALRHVNTRTEAGFELNAWHHYAFFNPRASRIEMHLVCDRAQSVKVADQEFNFEPFDSIWTESSYKYTPFSIHELARAAGFAVETLWTDESDWFGVALLRTQAK